MKDSKIVYKQPIPHRPRFGARVMVRAQFLRILHAILKELQDWKAECRLKAASLLHCMIIYTEEEASARTEEILLGKIV